MPGGLEVGHRPHRGVVGAGAADVVVDLGGRAVQGDLHVDVVGGRQLGGPLRGDPEAVGGELHPDVVVDGVVEQLPEVRPHRRLAAADVDVEDLHPLELVDQRLALLGGQLVRVAPARGAQAVHAGQVAGVGQLPGQADRGVQPLLELVDQPAGRRRGGRPLLEDRHGWSLRWIMPPAARPCRAPTYAGQCGSGTPAPRSASSTEGLSLEAAYDVDELGCLEEAELAGAEVVGQGAERLGSQGHRPVQPPGLRQHRREGVGHQ